jgi:hypothetical protein
MFLQKQRKTEVIQSKAGATSENFKNVTSSEENPSIENTSQNII